ncbi:hypothetical protein J2S22_002982 [Rhodoplanes tepidamans]|uniref:DUF3455 domain-containing protein n=1 Tax=Rhodoplanes TaxID=29407 RepID=UPI0027851965|nr:MULTISPECIES: DUF3455 domain-containing protein [Rhodoplanes]MDQ0356044.1 hypothetical protein [Rhodoplanes tepidamans]
MIPALVVATLAGAARAELPAAIEAPGLSPVLTVGAAGAQIYECKSGQDGKLAWTFREPVASLMRDGATVGRHYRGPTFEHQDGSAVVIKAVASAPSPDGAIPWLKADAVEKRGAGVLADVVQVQRINTRGGVLQGACETPGAVQGAAYTADYVFLRKAP